MHKEESLERKGPPPVLCASNWNQLNNDINVPTNDQVYRPEDLAVISSLNERIKIMAVPIANCLTWIFSNLPSKVSGPVQVSVNMQVGCFAENIVLTLGKHQFTYDLAQVHNRTECTALYLVNFLARHYCENNPNIFVKVLMNFSDGALEIKTSRVWISLNNK